MKFGNRGVAALVFVVDPAAAAQAVLIQSSCGGGKLGLTAVEGTVATMLCDAKTVPDIAVAMSRQEGAIQPSTGSCIR